MHVFNISVLHGVYISVLKQRMQVYNSQYKTCTQCGKAVLRQEGFRAFYRSYTTQLSMNIPFQSIHFMVYEACQDTLNPDREYQPNTHIVSGGMAGAIAAAATTPLDVCKTLLNTQERCAITAEETSINGMLQAFRTVYRFRGIPGFFQGLTARVVYQMPSTAISWAIYESFKYFLFRRQRAASDGYITPSPLATVQVHAVPPSTTVESQWGHGYYGNAEECVLIVSHYIGLIFYTCCDIQNWNVKLNVANLTLLYSLYCITCDLQICIRM